MTPEKPNRDMVYLAMVLTAFLLLIGFSRWLDHKERLAGVVKEQEKVLPNMP